MCHTGVVRMRNEYYTHCSRCLLAGLWLSRVDAVDVEAEYTMRGHSGAVLSLAISPTGEFCYSGGIDGTICCWNVPSIPIEPYAAYGKMLSVIVHFVADALLLLLC